MRINSKIIFNILSANKSRNVSYLCTSYMHNTKSHIENCADTILKSIANEKFGFLVVSNIPNWK